MATPMPIPASAPGESVEPPEAVLVWVGEEPLVVADATPGVEVPDAEVDVEVDVVGAAADDDVFVLEEEVFDFVGVEEEDEDEETTFWRMLHRTVDD